MMTLYRRYVRITGDQIGQQQKNMDSEDAFFGDGTSKSEAKGLNIDPLGYQTKQLKHIESMDYDERICSYYLRIVVKDIPGVLAKITSNLNEEGISIETILQLPNNEVINSNLNVPIIITTHETTSKLLNKVIHNFLIDLCYNIVEIMFGDFIALAADQIINHATKYNWMYNGKVTVPMIIRTPVGGRRGYGPPIHCLHPLS